MSVSKGSPIPCCVETDASFRQAGQYALRMLLVPLGLEPQWVSREDVRGGVYYGAGSGTGAAATVPAAPHAASYFKRREALRAEEISWTQAPAGRIPVLFRNTNGEPDLVASAFFWLSGWQEVVSDARDEHGRFPYAYSLQCRLDLAGVPAVDGYRMLLAEALRRGGRIPPGRSWEGHGWVLCPTHDVDYVRKWRPGIIYREVVDHLFRNARNESIPERLRRLGALAGQVLRGDPYRAALPRMRAEVARRGGRATYFIKSGGGDPHDVAYRVDGRFLRRQLRACIDEEFEIGLHPSYLAAGDVARLASEKRRLEAAARHSVTSVRNHYLRFDPVRTPSIHKRLGFDVDSTLGFAEHEGFRRGTCLPFQLYDVEADRPYDVWEMPLAVMDSTLFNRRKLDFEEAGAATRAIASSCRRFGGAMVVLWHNTLWDEIDCPGWGRHFSETLEAAHRDGALVASLRQALAAWRVEGR